MLAFPCESASVDNKGTEATDVENDTALALNTLNQGIGKHSDSDSTAVHIQHQLQAKSTHTISKYVLMIFKPTQRR